MSIAYMHTKEYLKQNKDGNIDRRDGKRFLKDSGREIVVNDGCVSAGIYDEQPAQKYNVKSDQIPFTS